MQFSDAKVETLGDNIVPERVEPSYPGEKRSGDFGEGMEIDTIYNDPSCS
jgi:hypothetical protein